MSKEDAIIEERIRKLFQEEAKDPEAVCTAREAAYMTVRRMAVSRRGRGSVRRGGRIFVRNPFSSPFPYQKCLLVAGAAFMIFWGVLLGNPVLAEKIPGISHVFSLLGNTITYFGEYEDYTDLIEERDTTSATAGNMTITLSEVYCSEAAMHLGMVLSSTEPFPETLTDQFGKQTIFLYRPSMTFDYGGELYTPFLQELDGSFLDENTYVGVLVLRTDFMKGTYAKDGSYQTKEGFSLPDAFRAAFHIYALQGYVPDVLASGGRLDTWTIEGGWDFSFDVTQSHEGTETRVLTVPKGQDRPCDIGTITVTKTPVEILVDYENKREVHEDGSVTILDDYLVVLLDAEGIPMEFGSGTGGMHHIPIGSHDVSTVNLYVFHWADYMNAKPYFWGEGYEERAKTMSFATYLEELCLYHKSLVYEAEEGIASAMPSNI